jgi:hypothetical protein
MLGVLPCFLAILFLEYSHLVVDVNLYLVVYEFALILYKFDIFYSVFYKVVTWSLVVTVSLDTVACSFHIVDLADNGCWMQCKVCMQTFICTTTEVKCREHAEAKHAKSDVYACFPHLKNDAGSVKQ